MGFNSRVHLNVKSEVMKGILEMIAVIGEDETKSGNKEGK